MNYEYYINQGHTIGTAQELARHDREIEQKVNRLVEKCITIGFIGGVIVGFLMWGLS